MRNSTTCTQEIKRTVIKSSLELTHKFPWCRLPGYGFENLQAKTLALTLAGDYVAAFVSRIVMVTDIPKLGGMCFEIIARSKKQ